MKKLKRLFLMFVAVCFSFILTACGPKSSDDKDNQPVDPPGPTVPEDPVEPEEELLKIEGVSFINKTVDYNGTAQSITITGTLPTGVSVQYTNNTGTNAGTYNATATLSGEGYETKVLTAKLIISKINYDMSGASWVGGAEHTYTGDAITVSVTGLPTGVSVKSYSNNSATNVGNYTATVTFNYDATNYNAPTMSAYSWKIKEATFTNVKFNSAYFDYDGNEKSIEIVGALPNAAEVEYSCKEDNSMENAATDVGTYTIVATITCPNYQTLVLEAIMVIRGEEDERFMTYANDTLYFANALDNDYLYSYDGTDFTRMSYDIPYNFVQKGSDIYFRSKALYNSSVKTINETAIETVASVKGEYLVSDGTYFYYAVNGLTNSNSGIYKLDISQEEPIITRLFLGKTKFLTYYNNYLYFADGNNGYKLTRLGIGSNTTLLLRDEKINTLTADNGYLFYTVNNLTGDYIESFKLYDRTYKKLTVDAGANLTLVGDRLYYINVDLLTSNFNGDGVCYVNAYPTVDMNLPGTPLFESNGKYSSLTKIGENKLAYYRVNDQMLCSYDLDSNEETEVLADFELEEVTPLSLGSKVAEYGGNIYYLDLYKGKTLCRYNTTTQKTTKITSNKVEDFSIIGDYLYYNSVSYLVNNDLYKINLKQGGEAERISTNDCTDVVFDGESLFFVTGSSIHQITQDGTEVEIYTKSADNLRYYDGYIYFLNGDNLHKMPTTNIVVDQTTMVKEGDVDIFEIDSGIIYYREVLLINKNFSCINIDGTGYTVLAEKTYDPVQIQIVGDKIYFYSDTTKAATAGLFVMNKDGSNVTCVLPRTVSEVSYYPSAMTVVGGDIYFINYQLGGTLGDSHLYKLTISNATLTKLA